MRCVCLHVWYMCGQWYVRVVSGLCDVFVVCIMCVVCAYVCCVRFCGVCI